MEHKKFFGTDGIRGVAGQFPLDNATVRGIAAAAARVLKKNKRKALIIMGRDTRESGKTIAQNLKKEFALAGIEVWDLGVIPTPGVAYMVKQYPVVAGIVISASHNPYQDNGIKFFGPRGTKLPDNLEHQIEKEIVAGKARVKIAAGRAKGLLRPRASLVKDYGSFLRTTFPKGLSLDGMKLVIDCANGATCAVAEDVLSKLGAKVKALNVSPDGRNINRDCGSLHPEKLAAAVAKARAHCGLAFDGDGDRIIFVDETGAVRDGDFLLSIAAKHWKESGKLRNNILVTTIMANLGLYRAMERQGIEVRQTPVGDRYVTQEMLKSGAVIGGEQSGHIIFRSFLSTGDGILSALQLLSIMQETGKPLSELSSVMEKYPQVLLNTRVGSKVPLESLPKTKKAIKDVESGLKGDGRVVVRYSGTETLLRVMIEGKDKKAITAMAQDISDVAKKEIDSK